VTGKVSIVELKSDYPCLFSADQVCSCLYCGRCCDICIIAVLSRLKAVIECNICFVTYLLTNSEWLRSCGCAVQFFAEFQRLTGHNVVDSIQEMLDKYGDALVRLAAKSDKEKPSLLVSQLTAVGGAKTQEKKRGWFVFFFVWKLVFCMVLSNAVALFALLASPVMWCLEALPRLEAASSHILSLSRLQSRSQAWCLGLATASRIRFLCDCQTRLEDDMLETLMFFALQ
jgi:hypothetical protein